MSDTLSLDGILSIWASMKVGKTNRVKLETVVRP